MSRARQAPSQPQPPQPQAAQQQPQVENMDIVAQAMNSVTTTHDQNGHPINHHPGQVYHPGQIQPQPGQEYPQQAPFNPFPQGMSPTGGPNPFSAGDQSFDLNDAFQRISLKPKEYVCELYDSEIVFRKGIVIQYLNSNSTGATNAIGVTRTNIVDPRKLPQYLSRNLTYIRQHAVSCLQTHMRMTLCAAGALEKLCPDDFSLSFSWASLTDVGRSLCLPGRNDLALGFAGCESLLMPILINKTDQFPTYVVNAYVYLQDTTRRSTTVIAKAKEDAAIRANPDRPKFVKKPPGNGYNNGYSERQLVDLADMAANRAVQNSSELKRAAPVLGDFFPPLPRGPAPEWNISGRTPLPEN